MAKDSFQFGTSSSYTQIDSDGKISLHGDARPNYSMWLNPGAIKVPGTKPASWTTHGLDGAWEFSKGTDDTVGAIIRLNKEMDHSVAPHFHIGWDSDETSGDCIWEIKYRYHQHGEDITASADVTMSAVASAHPSANCSQVTCFEITSAHVDDKMIIFRLKRRGDLGGDTVSGAVYLDGMGFKIRKNRLGKYCP